METTLSKDPRKIVKRVCHAHGWSDLASTETLVTSVDVLQVLERLGIRSVVNNLSVLRNIER
jgi:hypothetical protein